MLERNLVKIHWSKLDPGNLYQVHYYWNHFSVIWAFDPDGNVGGSLTMLPGSFVFIVNVRKYDIFFLEVLYKGKILLLSKSDVVFSDITYLLLT